MQSNSCEIVNCIIGNGVTIKDKVTLKNLIVRDKAVVERER